MDVSCKYIIEEAEFCMFYDEKFILHTKHRYVKNSLVCTLSATDKLCDICECSLLGQGCISHSSMDDGSMECAYVCVCIDGWMSACLYVCIYVCNL